MGRLLASEYTNVLNLGRDGRPLRQMTPELLNQVPEGSTVLISMGTNDVGNYLRGGNVNAYANDLVARAVALRDRGSEPVLIGIQSITAPYTQNPVNVTDWNRGVTRLNTAIEAAARRQGIDFVAVENLIPRQSRAPDNLHYNSAGYRLMARTALREADNNLPVLRFADITRPSDNFRLSKIDLSSHFQNSTHGHVTTKPNLGMDIDTNRLSGKYHVAAFGITQPSGMTNPTAGITTAFPAASFLKPV